jgi:hypothetical protein
VRLAEVWADLEEHEPGFHEGWQAILDKIRRTAAHDPKTREEYNRAAANWFRPRGYDAEQIPE